MALSGDYDDNIDIGDPGNPKLSANDNKSRKYKDSEDGTERTSSTSCSPDAEDDGDGCGDFNRGCSR